MSQRKRVLRRKGEEKMSRRIAAASKLTSEKQAERLEKYAANKANRLAQRVFQDKGWLAQLSRSGKIRTMSSRRADLATSNGFTARPDGKAYVITRKAA
jgi:hypothetical protein